MLISVRSVLQIILGIVLACLALEAVLQVMDQTNYDRFANDPHTGLLLYKPDIAFTAAGECYTNTVRTNSLGLHGDEPPPQRKKTDEFRIVLVGSSFVEATQVSIPDLISTKLANLLNAQSNKKYTYEVIPIGFSGNGTYLDSQYFLAYGAPLKPDLVINLTTDYDHSRAEPGASYADEKGNLIMQKPVLQNESLTADIKGLLRKSKLAMNLFYRFTELKADASADISSANSGNSDAAKQWAADAEIFKAYDKAVRSVQAQFMVTSWATPESGTSTALALHEELSQAAQQDDFAYQDLAPTISVQEAKTGISASFNCDAHWSAAGHSYAAQALYDYLTTHPSLLRKS